MRLIVLHNLIQKLLEDSPELAEKQVYVKVEDSIYTYIGVFKDALTEYDIDILEEGDVGDLYTAITVE